jgi:hypothetical protein
MTSNPQPDQHFSDAERLFRRVRRENVGRSGKATFLAFDLPDMSVNRERECSAEDARKGYNQADWAVVAFAVKDLPPRATWVQIVQEYQLKPRHVPARRGILLTRHAQQLPTPLPRAVRHVAFAPFQEILPLCAAVVHQGGIGTMARALAAGMPQLVLPLAWDQRTTRRACAGSAPAARSEHGTGAPRGWRKRWRSS